jgi:hypothetical protein
MIPVTRSARRDKRPNANLNIGDKLCPCHWPSNAGLPVLALADAKL